MAAGVPAFTTIATLPQRDSTYNGADVQYDNIYFYDDTGVDEGAGYSYKIVPFVQNGANRDSDPNPTVYRVETLPAAPTGLQITSIDTVAGTVTLVGPTIPQPQRISTSSLRAIYTAIR